MTADQKLVAEATKFLEENRKHLPGVIVRYLGGLLAQEQASTIALLRLTQEVSDLRALLYGNPDAKHDRIQSGEMVRPPQVFRQGGWEDA